VLYRTATDTDDDHALLTLGWPDAAWHLELVEDLDGETPPSPSEEDLLVLYLGRPVHDDVIDRHLAAGGERVPSHNPCWDRWGATLQDPDGYRLVLNTAPGRATGGRLLRGSVTRTRNERANIG
jgi:hypothetical protein